MKERNKGVEVEPSYRNEMDCYYSTSELFPCKKHPSSSSTSGGGICAYCLKDRLLKLVCSDCGEQRLSSCSCSDEITSNRNSNSCSVEVGSVGRVSFLIENEKNEKNETNIFQHLSSKSKLEEKEEVLVLRRSNSNCVEIKRNGFWRIGKLFKKKNKEIKECGKSVGGFDEKSNEMWMRVSRSRSLCSFRGGGGGGGVFGSEDGGESVILSGARSSISAARSSGVNGSSSSIMMLESGRRSGYSEAEPRRSNFDGGERRDFLFESENGGRKSGVNVMDVDGVVNRRVFSLRESDFKGMDESRFIDLKLDYCSSSETKNQHQHQQQEFSSFRSGNFMGHDGCDGGSCRITVNDRGVKRERKSMKGWKWIFRYHSNWGNGKKRDEENLMFKT